MNTTNLNANLNNSECIHSISNVGSTTYVNICSNTQNVVPWGSADWIGAIIFVSIVIGAILFFRSLARI